VRKVLTAQGISPALLIPYVEYPLTEYTVNMSMTF